MTWNRNETLKHLLLIEKPGMTIVAEFGTYHKLTVRIDHRGTPHYHIEGGLFLLAHLDEMTVTKLYVKTKGNN